MRYDLDAVRNSLTKEKLQTRPPSLWRYAELLPPDDDNIVSLGEGMSPLLRAHKLQSVAADNKGIALAGAALAAKLALDLPNSRTAESEADRIGTEVATRAGYAPEAAISLWQKMEKVGGNGPPQFLSTHPAPGNRQQRLAELAPQMKQLNPTGKKAAVYPVTMVQ